MAQLTAATEQNSERPMKPRGRPWAPGTSGNPLGHSRSKRHQALVDIIAAEFGGEAQLSAIEREFVSRAAEQLRRAERKKTSNDESVRLTRCAAQLIDRIRDRRARKAAADTSGLDHYLTPSRTGS